MEKIKTLGLYDSGLGGYSIYQALKVAYPNLNLVLYADQKNAPYGNKTNESIIEFAKDAMAWFDHQKIDNILIACNTVSAVALNEIREAFPNLKIVGIIDLTVSQVNTHSVGVISTQATYQSGLYAQLLEAKGLDVVAKPTADLVGLIENLEDPSSYLQDVLKDFEGSESLILACTHYPLVESNIREFFKGQLLDSRRPIVDYLKDRIELSEEPLHRVVTTGDPKMMARQIKKLFELDEKVEA